MIVLAHLGTDGRLHALPESHPLVANERARVTAIVEHLRDYALERMAACAYDLDAEDAVGTVCEEILANIEAGHYPRRIADIN